MDWTVSFAPALPWAVIIGLSAVGVFVIALMIYSRTRGLLLRVIALALLLAALFNPSLRNEVREPLTDIAVAVIDRSLSQENGDRVSRTNAAEAAIKEAVSRLGNTELRTVEVTSGISSEDDGTRAFAALNRALAEIPPERFAGAIMVTDGQIHDAPADLANRNIGGPVHGLLTGTKSESDRKVVIDKAPRFGIIGKEQIITFHVEEANGPGQPVDATVNVGRDDPIVVSVSPGQSVDVTVPVDHGGQNIVEIAVPPLDGEISTQNNRAVTVVEGVRDRLRVLLVSGEPHPGERSWRNLLKADASVDLVHFTILRPPEKQDGTPTKELALIAFPTRELFIDKLDEFDLVIFDRYRQQSVLPSVYMANIARYVQDGGAILIASGPDLASENGLFYTPLSDIIAAAPTGHVLEGGFKPKLTAAGRKHPVTSTLPGSAGEEPAWGRWFRLVETEALSGDTIMSGLEDKPLLVLSRTGKGRVAQMLSDQGWLWARGFEGGGPQTELLRRIAHWLMKEPDLEEEALTGAQSGKSLIIERRTMAEKVEPVTVTQPSGKTVSVVLKEVSPGRWRGDMPVTEAGLHRLGDGTLDAVAAAGSADAREMSNLVSTPAILAPVAAVTGGAVQWLEDGMPQLVKVQPGRQFSGSGWLGLRANGAHRVLAVTEIPLFASLLSLGALLLAFCAMWYREGR